MLTKCKGNSRDCKINLQSASQPLESELVIYHQPSPTFFDYLVVGPVLASYEITFLKRMHGLPSACNMYDLLSASLGRLLGSHSIIVSLLIHFYTMHV